MESKIKHFGTLSGLLLAVMVLVGCNTTNKATEQMLRSTRKELITTRDELIAVKEELTTVKANLTTAQNELKKSQQAQGTPSHELSAAKADLATANKELSAAKTELASSQDKAKQLENRLNEQTKEFDKLKGQLESSQNKTKTLEQLLKTKDEELAKNKQSRIQVEQELTLLKQRISITDTTVLMKDEKFTLVPMTSAIYEAQKYLSILEDDVPCKAVYDKLATLVVRSESVEEKRELCRVFKLYLHGKNKAFQNEFEGLVANNDKMLSAIYGTIDF